MKSKKLVVCFVVAFLFLLNFVVIFHSVGQKAYASWKWDGAFTLSGPNPCLCPHQGYTCICFYPNN